MTYNGFVFFDIDGTLVNSQGQVPIENKRAIAQLRANGFLPIVCTGRGRGEMGTVLEDAGIHSAILLNGMEILHEKQFLFEGRIAQTSILKLLQLAKENKHGLGFYSQGEMRVTALSSTVQQNFRYFHQDLPQVGPTIYQNQPCQMLLIFSEEPEKDTQYQTEIPELHFFRNSPYSIDITPHGCNKGSGIQHLLTLLADEAPTYAFGDGLNDLSMFERVDYSIAMGNSQATVKEAATFITRSNDENGIPYALTHFGLI